MELDSLISEELQDRKIAYSFNAYPSTNILTVSNKKDAKYIGNLLHVLCYKYATHTVSSKEFEILFN